jgi:DNA polymerase-3 subunit delta
MAKSTHVGALEYLSPAQRHAPAGVAAVYGDDAYLKREVLAVLRREVLAGDDGEYSLTTLAGRDAELRDVLDALATTSLFGGERRLVIVEEADTFVTEHRAKLEEYAARPQRDGVLVLEVKTWPATTRLAKVVAASGLAIDCRSLKPAQIKRWLTQRAKSQYGVRIDDAATDALLELLPAELGILEQELAKLSLLMGPDGVVDEKLVQENVGGWRTRTAWEMVDAAADGRAAEAIRQLERLIAAGEKPHGLLPQMSHSLRQLAAATQLVEACEAAGKRLPLQSALKQAGVLPFKLAAAERQLRQIGRERAKQLIGWLLAADLAIKGHNSADARARIELERLIVRLSAKGEGGRGKGDGIMASRPPSAFPLPAFR